MDELVNHVVERWQAYAITAAFALPPLVMLRRYVTPVLLPVLEIILYMTGLQIVLHGLVRVVRWFKLETAMYHTERADPGWEVPLAEFWNLAAYNPEWLFYAQGAALCLVTYIVLRHRPIRTQKKPKPLKPASKRLRSHRQMGASRG
ncbi:MAG: hypothetical protein ACLFV4_05100 [Candidatus Hydrogenedentota bacterium]